MTNETSSEREMNLPQVTQLIREELRFSLSLNPKSVSKHLPLHDN